MSLTKQIITIALCVIGTMITRFLPFIVFSSKKTTPKYIEYLGKTLPSALFAMLIVYCLKDVNITSGSYGIPEVISLSAVILIHLWKRKMLISILTGTVIYMLLVQLIF